MVRDSVELARWLARLIVEKKGEDLVILDVRGRAPYTDFILIASARSARHVQGLAEYLEAETARYGVYPMGVEGLTQGHWVVLDYGDAVVHLFYEPVREVYDLEGLWAEVPRLAPEETREESGGGD
ncbi:ribosome silencing factor [Thermosulfurimonas sp. F29]|uniref:ribosome silencing factor n=1 Tax=Thermosulfurimonas sp. F29 TaxID=2867247 RepID=UPI001C83AAF9|nr:ribosome silencing factor [Thermosulfurimonas sp. F29]MBX6422630.1 ribosome silencing factor [Thermosulfurimonas sp. F29]